MTGHQRPEHAQIEQQAAGGMERKLELLPGVTGGKSDTAQRDVFEREIPRALRRENLDVALERGIVALKQRVDRLDRLHGKSLHARGALGEEAAVDRDAWRGHYERSPASRRFLTVLAKCAGDNCAVTSRVAAAPMRARKSASPASLRSHSAASSTLASAHF